MPARGPATGPLHRDSGEHAHLHGVGLPGGRRGCRPLFRDGTPRRGPLLADIYLGKIKKWNAPAIAALNPGVKLPATDIAVVHRSEGSGTTYIWVDYLAKVSPEFKEKVGVNSSVNWPVAGSTRTSCPEPAGTG